MHILQLRKAIALSILVIVSFTATSQSIYYFDPTSNDSIEDGSILHPYNSFSDLSWENYASYLIKRGTTIGSSSMITIEGDYVTFGAYGVGDRPIVYSTTSQHVFKAWQKWDIVFQDLEIDAPNAVSAINFIGSVTKDAIIQNCKIHGSEWGIRGINGWTGIKILNCEIFNIKNDGIYLEVDSVEIAHCNIYNVNLDWFVNQNQSYSSGDCIQLNSLCDGFNVHHNTLDHSYTGNKFCFIADGQSGSSGIFEYNTCIGDSSTVFACVYLHAALSDAVVRYNTFRSAQTGIYSNAFGTQIYYNIIEGCGAGLNLANYGALYNEIYNNVFYNNHLGLSSNFSTSQIKNNIFYSTGTADAAYEYPYSNIITTDYNVIYPEQMDFIHFAYATFNTLSAYQVASGNSLNSIVADPLFLDAPNGDFHLQSNSPCIGAGIGVGLSHDYAGNNLTTGTIDCGVYQYSNPTINPGWNYVSSLNTHTILVPPSANISIEGDSISSGDYLGAFYDYQGDFVCCGYTQWTAAGCTLLAYGYDGIIAGLAPLEEIKIRVWRISDATEYVGFPIFDTAFPDTSLYNMSGQSSLLSMEAIKFASQILQLDAGWSMISGFINPISPELESVFEGNQGNIRIIKDENGDIYWPSFNVNQIGTMAPWLGYKINMNNSVLVELKGIKVVPEEISVQLEYGYGYFGYPYSSPALVTSILSSIINEVAIIKDENGLICWFDYNINEIGNFNPGKGYQIKMKSSVLFTYPSGL